MNLNCPSLDFYADTSCVSIGHGGGGVLTEKLISEVFHPFFSNNYLDAALDGAILPSSSGSLALSTDSFVVSPLFFRGGNIGGLAVNGSVNDVLCCGALPKFMSAGFIIEEGFSIDSLKKIAMTMGRAASEAGVKIVTADTKVVERGKCDGLFINTAALGWRVNAIDLAPRNVRVDDVVIVTGSIGRHGVAIMSERSGLEFSSPVASDSASLVDIAQNLFIHVPQIHALRDPTRGGIATVLNEIAADAGVVISIHDDWLPISPHVASACALLGLDPLTLANEGILLVFAPKDVAPHALEVIKHSKHGADACIIGSVTDFCSDGCVVLELPFGQKRRIMPFSGELLPRIC